MRSTDSDADWRRKLGRLRLGAEPIEEQLARLRRATIALTAVGSVVGLIFLAIFAAFGRLDVGALIVGGLLAPVIGWAWLDQGRLEARAASYLRERAGLEPTTTPPTRALGPGPAGSDRDQR